MAKFNMRLDRIRRDGVDLSKMTSAEIKRKYGESPMQRALKEEHERARVKNQEDIDKNYGKPYKR